MSKATDTTRVEKLHDELGEYSLHLMWTLRQEATRAFDPFDIRPVRALFLELIGRGYIYPKDLAEILGQVPPAISTIIAELEERDLLVRRSDPQDGRRVQLALTEAGEKMRQQLKDAWRQTGCERLSKLTTGEVETLIRIYRKLLEEPSPTA